MIQMSWATTGNAVNYRWTSIFASQRNEIASRSSCGNSMGSKKRFIKTAFGMNSFVGRRIRVIKPAVIGTSLSLSDMYSLLCYCRSTYGFSEHICCPVKNVLYNCSISGITAFKFSSTTSSVHGSFTSSVLYFYGDWLEWWSAVLEPEEFYWYGSARLLFC